MNPPTSAFQAVPEVAYATLEAAMQNWSHRVGQGGYGEVFAGDLNNAKVKRTKEQKAADEAAKKAQDEEETQVS